MRKTEYKYGEEFCAKLPIDADLSITSAEMAINIMPQIYGGYHANYVIECASQTIPWALLLEYHAMYADHVFDAPIYVSLNFKYDPDEWSIQRTVFRHRYHDDRTVVWMHKQKVYSPGA